jgi:hypothetical protein
MAALAVGTPWLTIAGNLWPEYYFNGVPFYSVLPDVRRFPCYTRLGSAPPLVVDPDGPCSPSMCAERIEADLPEIVAGAARLVSGDWDYPTALADHFARMRKLTRRQRRWPWSRGAPGHGTGLEWSVDQVHLT